MSQTEKSFQFQVGGMIRISGKKEGTALISVFGCWAQAKRICLKLR
jgi:hypothetical protein